MNSVPQSQSWRVTFLQRLVLVPLKSTNQIFDFTCKSQAGVEAHLKRDAEGKWLSRSRNEEPWCRRWTPFETEPNCLLIKAESNITLLCQKQPTWSHELNLSEWQWCINNAPIHISTQYIWHKYRSLTWFVL